MNQKELPPQAYPYRCPRHGQIILAAATQRCPVNGCDRPLNHAGMKSFAKPIALMLRRNAARRKGARARENSRKRHVKEMTP